MGKFLILICGALFLQTLAHGKSIPSKKQDGVDVVVAFEGQGVQEATGYQIADTFAASNNNGAAVESSSSSDSIGLAVGIVHDETAYGGFAETNNTASGFATGDVIAQAVALEESEAEGAAQITVAFVPDGFLKKNGSVYLLAAETQAVAEAASGDYTVGIVYPETGLGTVEISQNSDTWVVPVEIAPNTAPGLPLVSTAVAWAITDEDADAAAAGGGFAGVAGQQYTAADSASQIVVDSINILK